MRNKTYHRRKMLVVFLAALAVILGLFARLVYLMIFEAEYYQKKAEEQKASYVEKQCGKTRYMRTQEGKPATKGLLNLVEMTNNEIYRG